MTGTGPVERYRPVPRPPSGRPDRPAL